MNTFKSNKRFGGNKGNRAGGRGFNKPGFGGGRNFRNSERGGDSERNFEMFETTCSDCGKPCEVPFRPNGRKPVFCNDCFGRKDGHSSTGNFTKRPTAPAGMHNPQNNDRSFDELKKQLEYMNTKLDKLVTLAASFIEQSEARTVTEMTSEEPKKKAVKKAPSKKK